MLKAAAERGVKVFVIVYKEVEAALTLNSAHTKKTLEALHPNISVFRHPDHAPTGYDVQSELGSHMGDLKQIDLAKASSDAITSLYGKANDVVLFWAHHEKLVLIDRKIGFMGGLDLCFGRWDTSSHPIADAHPGNLDGIIFPSHDYNNARILDFANVNNWDANKLDRTKSSRMGWSDAALSMSGPIIDNLIAHFADRWNFILGTKYKSRASCKYTKLTTAGAATTGQMVMDTTNNYFGSMARLLNETIGPGAASDTQTAPPGLVNPGMCRIQLVRSCAQWSSGHQLEHSIANAYVQIIENAQHFIYIENQFFITATCDEQHPVINKIGAALVDRLLRAHQEGKRFKVWVVMPAVPAFAGHLRSDDALGTRAIMDFQYRSISRGGHSILEKLRQSGVKDPSSYISFYNLRNFDRINTGKTTSETEKKSGVAYEDARVQHDNLVQADTDADLITDISQPQKDQNEATSSMDIALDTISSCYMAGSHGVTDVPWHGEAEQEIDSFVSEELYVHTKLLIADDRVVICGSANLNDRSQLGTHDSEMAVVIEDTMPVDSFMNTMPYKAARFASSLRRYIFRKHLGMLHDQRWDKPDENWHPIDQSPNLYDWGSPTDILVRDPLDDNFLNLWTRTANTNTEVFRKAFHPVPDNQVRTWADYKKFFENYIITADDKDIETAKKNGKVEYGHVVRKEFPGGIEEVKAWLSRVRGSLVNMPLDFLAGVEDMAKQGWTLNGMTEMLYT